MRQRNTVASKLPSLIALALVLVFVGTLGQGKCWGDERGASTTFTVRYIGPAPSGITYRGKPLKAVLICGLEAFMLGKDGKEIYGWEKHGIGISGADESFDRKNAEKSRPYSKEQTRTFTVSDPKHVVTSLAIRIGIEGLERGAGYSGFEEEYHFKLPPSGSEVIVSYAVKEAFLKGYDNWTGWDIKLINLIQCSTVFDKQLKHVEVKESPPIRAAKDSPQVKKEEYTIKHSVGVQEGYKVEGELRANLAIVELGIKGSVERSTNRTYEESKTTTREVTIPGNGRPYKVVWVETYRTGKAITVIKGKKYEVPFEFREGWDLQTKEVKE